MNKYHKYKDSGIQWIGEIPEHWEVKRLKRLASICNGQDQKNVVDKNGKYPIYGSGGEFGRTDKYLHLGPSVLLGRKGTIDKPRYVEGPFWTVDTAYYTDIKPDVSPRLFYYLCLTIDFNQYKYGSAIPSMTQETLSGIPFSIPKSTEEQTQIAHYLNKKTKEIDELIAAKKKLLQLYEEEKTAIINQAVTKGINPNVPMKDSGIEWLGEIPAHWVKTKLKYVTNRIGDGIHSTPKYVDSSELKFVNGNNLENGEIKYFDTTRSVSKNEYEKHKRELKVGTVLISINGTIGKLAIYSGEKVILGKSAAYIELEDSIHNKYLFYTLKTNYVKTQFELSYSGSTINNLSLYTLSNLEIFKPNFDEQKSVVQVLEKELFHHNKKINLVSQLIKLFEEYRTTLISEVVTGKINIIE